MLRWPPRKKLLPALSFLAVGFIFILDHYRQDGSGKRSTQTSSTNNQKGCHLPHPDPYDPSIRQYISKSPPLKCEGLQWELTYLSDDERLHLNKTAAAEMNVKLTCFYRCYDRAEGDDAKLKFGEWIEFSEAVQIGCEFVETYCKKNTFPGTTVYYNNHNQIITRQKNPTMKGSRSRKNVILIVFDSVSHSNFVRNMPKSLEVLKSLYNSSIFKGMNKIGDQSFPNAVAFLSGKNHQTEFGDVDGYFDDHPLIWKNFEKAGYTTYYAEDYPEFNLFFYLAKGFRKKPVHHYFRPFWLNVYGSFLHRRSKFLCYGNQAMHNIELNYLSQFLRKNKDSPKFALNWLTELGHDYLNTINVADDDFSKFLRDHYDDLKESFLFVLSDHGHRFDSIRQTPIGRIEDRLPFFSMHIPNSFQHKFPALMDTIGQNTKVLTSFWDFYVTMRDILHLDESDKWEQLSAQLTNDIWNHNYSTRGQSLLRPIKVTRLGKDLVSQLNRLLNAYKMCARLKLSRVRHATEVVDELSASGTRYRVTVEATPSMGVFEALMIYNKSTNISTVLGNINRVNSYGNQSICVRVQELRKYCYCAAIME
ncbi:hypothetical protein RB195_016149 [Necator americanus]|uniref:Arylsulfatase n=1 Tax=Necator americanus TaxID=51031 RepID=A0ABR1E7X6_NECAM